MSCCCCYSQSFLFLSLFCLKVRRLFKERLELVVNLDGVIEMNLYTPFRMLSERWMAHVSELEGVNNMVKMILLQAPRTKLAAVDAMIANRKDCGMGSRESKVTKW